MHKASLKQAATEVLLEVAHYELRQPALPLGLLAEGRPVLAHHTVEKSLLGATPRVAVHPRIGQRSAEGT